MDNIAEITPSVAIIGALEQKVKVGATWFYWIVGLSLVNVLISFIGSDWSFIMGLGVTSVVTALIEYFNSTIVTVIGIAVIVFICMIFLVMGYFGGQYKRWAFFIGIIFYFLDSLLFILGSDFLSIIFHGYVLFNLFKGLAACNDLKKLTG